MAWEWVAPVSAASSAIIVGGIGIYSTLSLARRNAAHAEKLAREERRHDRLDATYVDLLMFVERAGRWTDRQRPLREDEEAAAAPSREDQLQVKARTDAYGSREVRYLFGEYALLLREIDFNDRQVAKRSLAARRGEDPDDPDRTDYMTPLKKLINELMPAAREKHKEIIEKVAEELQS